MVNIDDFNLGDLIKIHSLEEPLRKIFEGRVQRIIFLCDNEEYAVNTSPITYWKKQNIKLLEKHHKQPRYKVNDIVNISNRSGKFTIESIVYNSEVGKFQYHLLDDNQNKLEYYPYEKDIIRLDKKELKSLFHSL